MSHTCINCNVRFQDADMQREHYKTVRKEDLFSSWSVASQYTHLLQQDWHRYNLKRRIAELPPTTAEEFVKKVQQQKSVAEIGQQETSLYCNACHKQFNSEKSHANHLNSKKHKDNVNVMEPLKEVTTKSVKQPNPQEDDEDVEEVKYYLLHESLPMGVLISSFVSANRLIPMNGMTIWKIQSQTTSACSAIIKAKTLLIMSSICRWRIHFSFRMPITWSTWKDYSSTWLTK